MSNQDSAGKPVEKTIAEVVAPPPVGNPACLCRHSLGAHPGRRFCAFCDCVEFRAETPVELLAQDLPAELVARNPAFMTVAPEHVHELMRIGRKRDFLLRTVLLREGDDSDCIYLLLEGRVSVETELASDVPRHLANLGPGEFIGEMGTLHGVSRSATVTCIDHVQALELTFEEVREVFRQYPDLVMAFARLIRSRKAAAR